MTEEKVIEYEELLRDAMMTNNVEQLDEFIDDDLIFVDHLAQIVTKEDDLEAHRSGNLNMTNIEFLEQKIKLFGSIAVTVTKVALKGSVSSGERIDGEYCYTRVWQFANGKMKLAMGHCSSSPL